MTYPVADLAAFADEAKRSGDLDPAYPLLACLEKGMTEEEALWYSFVYVAYYNLTSANMAWGLVKEWLDGGELPTAVLRLPTGTERRGLRGGAPLLRHLESLREKADEHGGLREWLTAVLTDDPERNWTELDALLQTVQGNGRWASYKTREILWKVNGFPLRATDTGMANSTGPRKGLALFRPRVVEMTSNNPDTINALERMASELRDEIDAMGVELGIEELETALCDFKAMAAGRYYVGHDIDQQLEQLLRPGVAGATRDAILEARELSFPREYLGEFNGWAGTSALRKKFYAEGRGLLFR